MKIKGSLAAMALAVLGLQGCATDFFGPDEEPQGEAQSVSINCEEVEAEMLRVVAFMDQLNKEGSYSWQDVMVIMENYKIGNSPEKAVALKAANERLVQLWNLRDAKKCKGRMSAEPLSIPIKAPEVIENL